MNINRSEHVCFGRPRINDSRLEVYTVISDLYYLDQPIDAYTAERGIDQDGIPELLDYCQNLKCQAIDKPYEKYCSGCLLSTLHEGFDYKAINLHKLDEDIYTDYQKNVYLGNKEEIEEELYGKAGWIMASEVADRFAL